MLTETGRITGIDTDGLWVETIHRGTCDGCAARKGCGHALLDGNMRSPRGKLRVLPGEQAIAQYRIDDHVLISIPDDVVLRGSLVAYGLPLLGMLGGAIAAVSLLPGHPDLSAALGACLGLMAGFALVRRHAARHRCGRDYQPVLQGLAPPLARAVTRR